MIKKLIAVTTIAAFLGTSLTNPGVSSAQTISEVSQLPAIDVNTIEISPDLASVQEKFLDPGDGKKRLAVIIQDAHGIYDAQKNIRAIIQELQDRHGFNLVALEGGEGKSDHTLLRTFPDKAVNQKQVDKYLKRAELSGGEAAAILNPKAGIFYGIEDRELYFKNRDSFLKGLDRKSQNLHTLNVLEQKLDKIRDEIYPQALKQFHKKEQAYRRGQMALLEFLEVLRDGSSLPLAGLGLTKEPSLTLEKYPNLSLIFQAMATDRDGSARSEPSLTKKEMEEKERELTAKVEGKKLFEEMKALSREIKARFFRDGSSVTFAMAKSSEEPSLASDIKTLDTLYSRLQILEDLSSLEISREDLNHYLTNKTDYDLVTFLKFLDKYHDSMDLEVDLKSAEAFYEDALKRDGALYKNFLGSMRKENQDRAVVVVGGFHTDGFKERLQKDGISYLILSPRIERIEEENPYYRVMEGKVSYRNTLTLALSRQGRGDLTSASSLAWRGEDKGEGDSIQVILATMGLASPEMKEQFLESYVRGGLAEVAKDVQSLKEADRQWREAIIKAVKTQGALNDPSDLLAFVEKLIREVARQKDGKARIREILRSLEQAFKDTLDPLVKERVNEFTARTQALQDHLKGKELKEIHLSALFEGLRSSVTLDQTLQFIDALDLIQAGKIQVTQAALEKARKDMALRNLPAILIQGGTISKTPQAEPVTLEGAVSQGALGPFIEAVVVQLAEEKSLVTAHSLGKGIDPAKIRVSWREGVKAFEASDDVGRALQTVVTRSDNNLIAETLSTLFSVQILPDDIQEITLQRIFARQKALYKVTVKYQRAQGTEEKDFVLYGPQNSNSPIAEVNNLEPLQVSALVVKMGGKFSAKETDHQTRPVDIDFITAEFVAGKNLFDLHNEVYGTPTLYGRSPTKPQPGESPDAFEARFQMLKNRLELYERQGIEAFFDLYAKSSGRLFISDAHLGQVVFAQDGTPKVVDAGFLRRVPEGQTLKPSEILGFFDGAVAPQIPGLEESEWIWATERDKAGFFNGILDALGKEEGKKFLEAAQQELPRSAMRKAVDQYLKEGITRYSPALDLAKYPTANTHLGKSLGEASLVAWPRISRIAEEKILGKNGSLGMVLHARDVLYNLSPPVTANDLAKRLAELEAKAFGYEEPEEKRWRKMLSQTPGALLLLVDPEGRLQGSISKMEEGGVGHLEQIITEHDGARGRGELLMDAYLNLLKKRGIRMIQWTAAIDSPGFYHRYLAPRFYYDPGRGSKFTVYLDTDTPELKEKWQRSQVEYLEKIKEREEEVKRIIQGLKGEYVFTEETIPTRFRVLEDGSWQYLSGDEFFKDLGSEVRKKTLIGRLTYRMGVNLWDAAGDKRIVASWNKLKASIPEAGHERFIKTRGRSLGQEVPEISEERVALQERIRLIRSGQSKPVDTTLTVEGSVQFLSSLVKDIIQILNRDPLPKVFGNAQVLMDEVYRFGLDLDRRVLLENFIITRLEEFNKEIQSESTGLQRTLDTAQLFDPPGLPPDEKRVYVREIQVLRQSLFSKEDFADIARQLVQAASYKAVPKDLFLTPLLPNLSGEQVGELERILQGEERSADAFLDTLSENAIKELNFFTSVKQTQAESLPFIQDLKKRIAEGETKRITKEPPARSEGASLGKTVIDVLTERGIDPDQFTVLIYPAAGNYDEQLSKSLIPLFPQLKEIHLIDPSYKNWDPPQMPSKMGERISEVSGGKVKVYAHPEDYSKFRVPIADPGRRILIDKWPGFNAEPDFYEGILQDTRPGDLILSVPTGTIQAAKWPGEIASMVVIPGYKDWDNFTISLRREGDRDIRGKDAREIIGAQSLGESKEEWSPKTGKITPEEIAIQQKMDLMALGGMGSPDLSSALRKLTGLNAIGLNSKVYSPLRDGGYSFEMADEIVREAENLAKRLRKGGGEKINVLDVGSGTGLLLATAIHQLAGVRKLNLGFADAIDINPNAVENTRFNMRLLNQDELEKRSLFLPVEEGREFEGLGERKYDLIIFNAPDAVDLKRSPGAAVDSSTRMDEETFKRILNETQNYLAPGGVVLVRNLMDILGRGLIPEGFDAEPAGLSPEGVFWQPQSSSMIFRLVRSHAVKGRSLGAVLSEVELSFLASELGFGRFEATEEGRRAAFAQLLLKLTPATLETIGKELREHILNRIVPQIFKDETDTLKLLVQSKRLLSQEALGRQVRKVIDDMGRVLPALGEEDRKGLSKIFVSILRGVPGEVISQKIKAEEEVRRAAESLYRDNTRSSDQKAFMKIAAAKLNRDLAAQAEALKDPDNKTVIAAEIGSLPVALEEVKETIRNAFQAVPKDEMGPRLNIFIYYTASEANRTQGIRGYLAELRKEDPLLASKIQLKQKTLKAVEDAFESHKNRQKPDENLIFMVPDLALVANLKESHVMLHQDDQIPPNLAFVKGILSQVAVGLAAVLKLPENDVKRTEYLNYLKDNLGMSFAKDAERQQFIIGFNLRALVEKLVELQRAQQAIRTAA